MKRVLLIQPPFFRFIDIHARYFPYQLVSMGTYLKNNGHEVRVLEGDKYDDYGNLDFSNQESLYENYLKELKALSNPFWSTLEAEIQDYKPDYIGITVWTTFIASAIRTAQFCKKILPSAQIIAGGPHVTLLPEDLTKVNAFDHIVVGEGEETLLEIVNEVPANSIQGVLHSDNGSSNKFSSRPFAANLDSFGIPDRSILINEDKYEDEDMGLIMTSRGCPFSCAYCATSIWEKKVRGRSIDNIIQEIKHVKNTYGTIYFTIKDDSFLINKKRVLEFCNKIKEERLNINWECNANLKTIDSEILDNIKSAGCTTIKVGVESGSNRIHELINKKLTNEIIKDKVNLIKSSGLHLTCYFMMGIPGETREDILKTLKFANELKPDFISFSVYEIFPGTEFFKRSIENKTAVEHMEIEDYFNVLPHNYFFTGNKRHLAGMSHDEFNDLEKLLKNNMSKYNRSLRNILFRIKSRLPLYTKNINYISKDIKSFLKWH